MKFDTSKGEFIQPMLASKPKDGKSISDYSRNDWVLEEKFDGHRLIVKVEDGTLKAWSRVGNERALNPKLTLALTKNLPNCTLDGELYLPGGTSTDVTTTETLSKLKLVFFDVLGVSGMSALKTSGVERRALLEEVGKQFDGDLLRVAEQLDPTEENLHRVWNRGGEGGILKKRDAVYYPGKRSRDWVKLKKEGSAIVRVTGFEAGLNGPYSTVVGVSEDGHSLPVKTLNREEIRQFTKNPQAAIGRHLMISFQNRTSSGSFRHPMWDRWIGDGE